MRQPWRSWRPYERLHCRKAHSSICKLTHLQKRFACMHACMHACIIIYIENCINSHSVSFLELQSKVAICFLWIQTIRECAWCRGQKEGVYARVRIFPRGDMRGNRLACVAQWSKIQQGQMQLWWMRVIRFSIVNGVASNLPTLQV